MDLTCYPKVGVGDIKENKLKGWATRNETDGSKLFMKVSSDAV